MMRIVAMLLAISLALAPGAAAAHADMAAGAHGTAGNHADGCADDRAAEHGIHCCSMAPGHCTQGLTRSEGGLVHRDGRDAGTVMPIADRTYSGTTPEIALPPPRI